MKNVLPILAGGTLVVAIVLIQDDPSRAGWVCFSLALCSYLLGVIRGRLPSGGSK